MFALFMDYMVRPIIWATSPNFREHQRNVKTQNAHLDGEIHTTPDPNCWYCKARAESDLDLFERTMMQHDWQQAGDCLIRMVGVVPDETVLELGRRWARARPDGALPSKAVVEALQPLLIAAGRIHPTEPWSVP